MELSILVMQFSEGFCDVWPELATDLAVELRSVEPEDGWTAAPDVSAIVLAISAAEHEAGSWLAEHAPPPSIPCLAVGSSTGHRTAARLVASGATDYFALPGDIEVLRNALAAAIEGRRAAVRRTARDAETITEGVFAEIIGGSGALKSALGRAARVLPHRDGTVLITGPTGVGKELLARAIHRGGPRCGAPFVPVNCTALPGHLLESELFGHEKGAFTDAHAAKPGLFEVADGGTLFLDEIGHLALDLQGKMLRVLEDRQVRRVGGTTWREVDVRIMAATNEVLEAAVAEGTFREDLYYRLSVITLSLPPLFERADDVILIAEALLDRLAAQHDLPRPELSDVARRALKSYHWPGNVRELKNSVERALLLSPPGELNVDELLHRSASPMNGGAPIPFPAPLREITGAAATAMLSLCQGNRSEAARRLGISRARLSRLMDHEPSTAG